MYLSSPCFCRIYLHSHHLVLTGTKPACANQFPPVTVDKVQCFRGLCRRPTTLLGGYMKVTDFNCVFAVTMLTLGSAAMANASILSASLNNPVSPLGNVITPVNFSGPVGSSPIFGLGFEGDFSAAPKEGGVRGPAVGNDAGPV